MIKHLVNLQQANVLPRAQQKSVLGGVIQNEGYCGVKINGEWRRLNDVDGNGTTIEQAQNYVQNGWATNWCCDSCPWNQVQA